MNNMRTIFLKCRQLRVHALMLAIPAVIIIWKLTTIFSNKGQHVETTRILDDTSRRPEKTVLNVQEVMGKLTDGRVNQDDKKKYSGQGRHSLVSEVLNVKEEMNRLNEEKVEPDDPRLIQIIRDHYIIHPTDEPYNLGNPNKTEYSGQGKDFLVPNTIKDLPEKGFFIECGAYDGEFLSSTLYFEKEKHWNGLLIEANSLLFNILRKKNRKAYLLNACLNTKPYPSIMKFNQDGAIGRLVEGTYKEAYRHHHGFKFVENVTEVQCFPLYSVLLALNQTNVDYMGLDVEGTELPILKTVPWDKVNITAMLVEFSHSGNGFQPTKAFLESNGYTTMKVVEEDILVHKK